MKLVYILRIYLSVLFTLNNGFVFIKRITSMIFSICSYKMRLFTMVTINYIMWKYQCFLPFEKQVCILVLIYNLSCVGDISSFSNPIKLKRSVTSKITGFKFLVLWCHIWFMNNLVKSFQHIILHYTKQTISQSSHFFLVLIYLQIYILLFA
jgi:hypothetical protein